MMTTGADSSSTSWTARGVGGVLGVGVGTTGAGSGFGSGFGFSVGVDANP